VFTSLSRTSPCAVQLCLFLGVAPLDQHLFHDVHGELGPREATLGTLRVEPGAILRLKTDQSSDMFEVWNHVGLLWRSLAANADHRPLFCAISEVRLMKHDVHLAVQESHSGELERGFTGTSLVHCGTWIEARMLTPLTKDYHRHGPRFLWLAESTVFCARSLT